MYLSYSGFKKYMECPRAYWHGYINKTAVRVPDNRVGMLYGSITGTLFEHFYNDRLWRSPDPIATLLGKVSSVAHQVVTRETKTGVLNWKDPKMRKGPKSLDEVLESVRQTIPNGIRTIRHHRLLGLESDAEVKLDSDIGGHRIGGRCDFRIRRLHPLSDQIILDGKGSQYRDRYVDIVQLRWYGMLHRRKFGNLPDQVGFLYWRSEPQNAIDWTTPRVSDIDELETQVLETIRTIETKTRLPLASEAFPARPKPFNCRFCSYKPNCPEGQVMTSNDRPQISSETGVEDVTLD